MDKKPNEIKQYHQTREDVLREIKRQRDLLWRKQNVKKILHDPVHKQIG